MVNKGVDMSDAYNAQFLTYNYTLGRGGSRKSVRGWRFAEGGGGHGQKTISEVYLRQ
jgi:hypothetical protein